MTSNAGLPATADPDRVSAKQDPTLHLLTTEELRSELGRAIGLTVQSIVRVATIWAELERRGEDLSDIRFTLKAFLPLVARGQLAPEAVVEMAGQQRKLELFLPTPDRAAAPVAGRPATPGVQTRRNTNHDRQRHDPRRSSPRDP